MLKISRGLAVLFVAISMWGIGFHAACAEEISKKQVEQPPLKTEGWRWRSTSAAGVSTGDYGTGQDTTIAYVSETLKYRGSIGEIGVTVPYLFQHGGGVTAGESRRLGTRSIPEKANGLGDIQVKGNYYWLQETAFPSVDLTGRVKVPTASQDKGLGTGRVDVGVGTELYKHLGPWIGLGDFEVVVRDRPSGSTLKPVLLKYAVGGGYTLTERFTPYLTLEGSTRTSSGAEPPLELVLAGVYKLTQMTSVQGYVLAGLTDGSPDFGAGTGLTVRF